MSVRRRSRRSRRAMSRIARRGALALLLAQVGIIATLVGVDNYRKRIRPLRHSFPHTEPASVPVGDSMATVFTFGEDLYADMLAAIGRAEERVLIESYIWKGDEVGRRFKDALVAAAERGVEVFVIYDQFANLVVSRSFKRFPSSVNVLTYPLFRARRPPVTVRNSGRDHRKILVVDHDAAYVGGYNIGSTYATQWRDTHVKVEGPSVWDLANAFIDFWNSHRRRGQPSIVDEGSHHWESRIRVHRNSPSQVVYPIRGMYLEAIDRARHHVMITQAYLIPDVTIVESLVAAAGRGVKVQVLVPAVSNHVVADWLSRGFYSTLLRAGIEIWRYQHAMVHAKTATIDGGWTTIGTANIDRLSLTGNYEVNLEAHSDALAAHMEVVFAEDLRNAERLDPAEWDARPWYAWLSEKILAPLRPLL